jgi:release factor glutamine methyltransferase
VGDDAATPPAVRDIRAALKDAMHLLRAANVPSHTLAAELLLMHAVGRDRAWLYTHPEAPLDPAAAQSYSDLIARRAAGEPTQYLTGKQEFWGLEFEVNPSVLIPRPETEHIMEVALARLGHVRSLGALRVADVGTGSGCLAVALACELPNAEIFATDISPAALEVARRNSARHSVADRVRFIEANLLDPFLSAWPDSSAAAFELIVSNPPYIGLAERTTLQPEVRDHEPASALFAGEHGLDVYKPLIRQAEMLLVPGGILVLELGHNALAHVRARLEAGRAWQDIGVTNDLARIPRVISATRA